MIRGSVMMSERFTYSNGRVNDTRAQDDLPNEYNLNNDEGRKQFIQFCNDREKMIDDLNNEITRLHKVIDDYGVDIKNLHGKLRKQNRITNNYKEISQILMETIGEIE